MVFPIKSAFLYFTVLTFFSVSSSAQESALAGFIDKIDKGVAAGWALDRKNPSPGVEVQFYVDDPHGRRKEKLSGATTANLPRPDLLKAGFSSEKHGFLHEINSKFLDGKSHRLYAFIVSKKFPANRFRLMQSGMKFKYKLTRSKKQAP